MPSARRLLWSRRSKQDLRVIWQYYSQAASTDVADRLLSDIASAARRACERPTAWRSRSELVPGVRSILVRPYTLFFRFDADLVEIVRVVHERRDFVALFTKDRKSP